MKQTLTREDIELKQEALNLEKEQLGMEIGMNEAEREIMTTPLYGENNQKISIGLGTMVAGRILFGKFGK